jgi:hypothetical protein
MDDAIRLAKAMSTIPELPKHLHDSVGTCLMVVDQAMRWRMSPFAVAQHSFNIGGKMGYEGKIMAAAVESMGAIIGGFDYKWAGTGDDRTITVKATRAGESEPREMTIRLGDVKTTNEMWKKQPDQQLVYSGCRNWARRWTPAALLGAYAPEEFDRPQPEPFAGTTVEGKAETQPPEVQTPRDEQSQVYSRRDEVNRSVPMDKPPERTPAQMMDAFEEAIKQCSDQAAVSRLLGSKQAQAMRKEYKDADAARLEDLWAAAIASHREIVHQDDSDGWPGPTPASLARERETASA